MRRLALVLLLVDVAQPITLAKARDLTGVYTCTGRNAVGNAYTATVQIQQTGDTYHVRWVFDSGDEVFGVGLVEKDRLVVAVARGYFLAVVVYRVTKDTLTGVWTQYGTRVVLTETLTPQPRGTVPAPPASPVPPPPVRERARGIGRSDVWTS